jgi:hypothetical protein
MKLVRTDSAILICRPSEAYKLEIQTVFFFETKTQKTAEL